MNKEIIHFRGETNQIPKKKDVMQNPLTRSKKRHDQKSIIGASSIVCQVM
jgi:hypothetical protein